MPKFFESEIFYKDVPNDEQQFSLNSPIWDQWFDLWMPDDYVINEENG